MKAGLKMASYKGEASMEQSLVFGGLSPIGFQICEQLLGEGISVQSCSSAVNDLERQFEEEQALFLGRNALFHHYDASSPPLPFEAPAGRLFFVDVIKSNAREQELVKERVKNIFDCLPQDKSYSLNILSSLAVYGQVPGPVTEETPSRPDTLTGRLADEMETFFIERLLSRRGRSLNTNAVILRLGGLETEREGAEEPGVYGKIDAHKAARLMIAAASIRHDGLEVLQFCDIGGSAGKEDEHSERRFSNQKIKTFLGEGFSQIADM